MLGVIPNYGSLPQIVASGTISNLYYSPTTYGTIIRFRGTYTVYICIENTGENIWVTSDRGGGEAAVLEWTKLQTV